jgi:hypothetical protein
LRTASHLRCLYLAYLSKPKADRPLYRAISRYRPRRILEIGLGAIPRTLRLIDLATRIATQPVKYAVIDLFEARPAGAGSALSLKDAHRILKTTTAQVQLIPGDATSALARSANALQNMDLVIISGPDPRQSLGGGWFYLPRMLHDHSVVFIESAAAAQKGSFALMAAGEITARAAASRPRRAA